MLSTKKTSDNCLVKTFDDTLSIIHGVYSGNIKERLHLYITSNDAIKDGDWFLHIIHKDTDNECVYVSKMLNNNYSKVEDLFLAKDLDNTEFTSGRHYERKIIATTDPDLIKFGVAEIRHNFVENVFIPEYNKGNIIKEVLVEYDFDLEKQSVEDYKMSQIPGNPYVHTHYKLKLRSDNTIIIHKQKEVFSLEDIKNAIRFGFVLGEELEPSFYKDHSLFKERMEQWIEEQN